MAEFKEVMEAFDLMHRTFERDCKGCPMGGSNIGQCRKLLYEKPEQYERIVMNWSVSRYPTWEEWQKETFPEAADKICPLMFMDLKPAYCDKSTTCAECRTQYIPAKIAKKLGIKP